MLNLEDQLASLPEVGPQFTDQLASLQLHTVADLLYYAPFRYEDVSLTSPISSLQAGETVTVKGSIISIKTSYLRSGKTLQKAVFSDGTATLDLTWFNQPFLVATFTRHPQVSLSGKVTSFRQHLSLTSPQYELISDINQATLHTGRIVPIYHITKGITHKRLRKLIAYILEQITLVDQLYPFAKTHQLVPLQSALNYLHFPQSIQEAETAKQRLAYDELFELQLASQWRKRLWQSHILSHQLVIDPQWLITFTQSLPFNLTPAQERCLNDVLTDLVRPSPMNRLIQGDVGSGKTIIAAFAMIATALNHKTSILMAPTEILALQHAESIQKLANVFNLTISVQTRSRRDSLDQASIIIGTQAVLHRQLPQSLGLVVIDEQHRFGVEQRMQLLRSNQIPHVLAMTATPIPRTVALSLYADLDVSVIDQMPVGRTPIKTWVVPEAKRQSAYDWIIKEITTHHTQAFVICPFIAASENPLLDEVKAATTEFDHLQSVLNPLKLGMVHGGMKPKEKQTVMSAFQQHHFDVLLATPVIEVGIDIKNATIIMIESAERFGLAALHQLRGRVGRGDRQSYCLLFSSNAKEVPRLKHVEKIHSGFELAQLDFTLRGPGDLYGTKQSGYINLTFASLTDADLIVKTHTDAKSLLSADDQLSRYPALKARLQTILANQTTPH